MRDAGTVRLWQLDPEHGHAPWRATPDRAERVLHVHLATPEEPQTSLCNALASLAAGPGGYRRIDWTALPFAERQRAVLDAAAELQPTLVFMQLQAQGVLAPSTLAALRRASPAEGRVIATWCGDVGGRNGPFPTPGDGWAFETAAHCDLVLYSSLSQVRAYRARGMHRAAYLQIGYEEDRYFEGPDEDHGSRWDAVFLGVDYDRRVAGVRDQESALRRTVVAALRRELGSRFGLFGAGWQSGVAHLPPALSGDEYRRSHLALSVSLFSSIERYTSDRLFRALACGTPVLMKSFADWRSFGLVDGESVVVWDGPDEAVAKARSLLQPGSRDALRAIGRRGARLAREHHSWGIRMKELWPLLAAVRGASAEPNRPW